MSDYKMSEEDKLELLRKLKFNFDDKTQKESWVNQPLSEVLGVIEVHTVKMVQEERDVVSDMIETSLFNTLRRCLKCKRGVVSTILRGNQSIEKCTNYRCSFFERIDLPF
jgi:hypothetical protein